MAARRAREPSRGRSAQAQPLTPEKGESPSPETRSALKVYRPLEHIATVSTYHDYTIERLTRNSSASFRILPVSEVGITGCRGCAFTMSLDQRVPISISGLPVIRP